MKHIHIRNYLAGFCAVFLMTIIACTIDADAATASLSTDRVAGTVSYEVTGLDLTSDTSMQVEANNTSGKTIWQDTISLTSDNCSDGVYTSSFTLSDLGYAFSTYTVNITVGSTQITAGNADLSIHTSNATLKIKGNKGAATRSAILTSTESSSDVLVPGSGNKVSVQIWNKDRSSSTAKTVGSATALDGSYTWSIDVSSSGNYYGTWCAKAVVTNSKWSGSKTLASDEYSVIPTCKSFTTKKTKKLEKKQSFGIYLKGLKNTFGIQGVTFSIINSSGTQVATLTGKKKSSNGRFYYKAVTMKKLKYNLSLYTIKATIIDNNNKTYSISTTATADQRLVKGTLKVNKKKNATCVYKLSGAYVPGNIKKVTYTVYSVKSGKKKKIGTYKATASSNKKKYTATVSQTSAGKYMVRAYATTAWGSNLPMGKKTYKLKKSDLGKNGWYYEKYNGKKYKFYYINNVKQQDLTKILKLKKSSSTHTNKFYIEVNRAACVVTIYMYNTDTNKYDIPVKTCTVCVGRDVSTVAGTSALNEDSSYTPIGTYSVSSNGQSVKYTLKPMTEPDGSVVYARWATHIVGNVYFHSIAVSTQSHYALPSYRYNLLGSPASAGCIRMAVADAKWIYDYTSTGNTVKIVKGSTSKPGPLGKAATIKIKDSSVTYDPTDPGVPDSRKKKDYKAGKITGYMTKKGKKVGY